MASYEALRHVTIGRYIPGDTPIHRLDPRAKLFAFATLIGLVLVATSYASSVLLLGLVLSCVLMAQLPIGYLLSNIRPALPAIAILSLLQLLFYRAEPGAPLLLAWGKLHISFVAVRVVIVSLIRFLVLTFLISLLTNTTTTSSLTNGLESLLRPLSRLGLPGHEIALVGAVALRFVPILGEELESIAKAQDARSVDDRIGGRWQFVHNARRVAALIVPLFVDAYRRAEEMILAMRARCYHGGEGRTHLVTLTFSSRDYVALGLMGLSIILVLTVQQLSLP
ncbi:MAG: energy-coupling factor transporter transmembrane component T [Chloroflexota bacterium]|nr:energy-coupling factor transporter transmembrane component T [Chloroflexota bacterium]